MTSRPLGPGRGQGWSMGARRGWRAAAIAALVLAVMAAAPAQAARRRARVPARPVLRAPGTGGGLMTGSRLISDVAPASASAVALTFDDGPDPRSTPKVLDLLDAHRVKATFFVVGRAAAQYPDLVRQIVARGHTVAVHTWNHRSLAGVSPSVFAAEVDPEVALLTSLTGIRPTCLRPPYGASTPATVAMASQRGLSTVIWSVDPTDWARPGIGAIVTRVISGLRPNAIILMHDGGGDRGQTVAALGAVLDRMDATGLHGTSICTPVPTT